jgi:hypothetical protein
MSCVECEQGIAASNHASCVGCQPGKAPNNDHTSCVACTGRLSVSGDGMACITCKPGTSANRAHTGCVGPTANPLHPSPRTSTPLVNPMNPGILEGPPGLGSQGPSGVGRPIGGSRGPASVR